MLIKKINRSTTDKELREKLYNFVYDNNKKEFIKEMDKLIERKMKKEEKQLQIIKNI